jgi:acylphosphatase
MADKCIRALVSGRVQGVFFRDSTRRQAVALDISGHAINLADGRVEVLACGNASSIDSLLQWLHQGPPLSRVEGVQWNETETVAAQGFTIG